MTPTQEQIDAAVTGLRQMCGCGHDSVPVAVLTILEAYEGSRAEICRLREALAGWAADRRLSKPLTFGELGNGDAFIAFPQDGDDSGHGGFRKGTYLFGKLGPTRARRCIDDQISDMPESMPVIRVLL